ncbi:hypothetical protein VTL71DRAFT_11279 [Oculimacula yallundae]|uniref:Uncharacterized protein n=1 Tax=Oculimacula yallundae TaxID=86028 RepID=A0ABR4BPG6_9HELO
MNPNQTLRGEG